MDNNLPPYEFSKFWEYLSRRFGLSSEQQPGNVRPLKPKKERKRRIWLRIVLALVALCLVLFFGRGVYLYTEWLWFGEVGYRGVFWTSLLSRLGLGFGAGAIFFAFIYGNVLLARRMSPRFKVGPGSEIVERVPVPDRLLRLLIPLGLLLPTLVVIGAGSSSWLDFLKFLDRAPFGINDPVFGHDVGFYVFALPFLRTLQSYVWWTLILTFLATAGMHFFDYAINWEKDRLRFAPHVKGHLSVLLGLIMFTLGAGYLLKGYTLMFSPRGVVFGASYTDVHAQLPVYKFLFATALLAGLLFLINTYFRGWKLPIAAIGIIVLTAIFAGAVYPFVVQQYEVSPNELAKEAPYIKNNIDFTRQAFDLNGFDEKPFAASDNLTAADVQYNAATINNIRLWEPSVLGQTYNQIQVIRLYYSFPDVDVDRYRIGGNETQVMLSARELAVDNLPDQAKTWQNEHLVYTHGYGLAMSQVAQVSSEGLPQLLIKDLPPKSSTPELNVTNPAIYYGEQANDYVVVDSSAKEFDYPQGDQNVYTNYAGKGGVDVSSLPSRLAFSWRFASLKLLVSDAIQNQTRIMIHRNISDRIRDIAPFLRYDKDPYLVLAGGRLYWIQDAYTTSDSYPYSQPAPDGYNYIRNSVKVVVDAYNGDVTFYAVDDTDPVLRTYENIFPGLFTPGSKMPDELRQHLRYPEDLLKAQAQMYATYHMTDPQVFYNKEDQWSIPTVGPNGAQMNPYYVIMSLPGETQEQFMLLQPFVPSTKDNMISWMAAKCDPGVYGQRTVFTFPKDKLVYGPQQIMARFNQDPTISQQVTLWNQSGSQVIYGNLLVIPIDQSILYVQPLYLRASQGQIPELKRVLVSYGNQVIMEQDLATALGKIFGTPVTGVTQKPPSSATTPAPAATGAAPSPAVKALINAAATHYNNAVAAQQKGDWATYGSELKALQDTLAKLKAAGGG
ncbi:MAG: UPF0182 family membrane protein [Thermoleophilia bacterium]